MIAEDRRRMFLHWGSSDNTIQGDGKMLIGRVVLLAGVFVLASCGGGRWVDAPEACMAGWGVLGMANIEETTRQLMNGKPSKEPETKDLKRAFEQMLSKEKKATAKDVREAREALDSAIAMGARSVCGNAGKSYAGDWECSETQQRVKCK